MTFAVFLFCCQLNVHALLLNIPSRQMLRNFIAIKEMLKPNNINMDNAQSIKSNSFEINLLFLNYVLSKNKCRKPTRYSIMYYLISN